MRQLHCMVAAHQHGWPVKRILGEWGMSLTLLRSLKTLPDGLLLDGQPCRSIDRAVQGQTITVCIPDDACPAQPGGIVVPVMYQDDDVMVLDKPAGMPVHPVHSYRDNTLANAFAEILLRQGKAAAFRPLNRLDRNTSGLVVAALHPFAAAKLTRRIAKHYTAICCGELSESGVIDAPLRIKEGYGICREVGEGGQRAVTHYTVLAVSSGYSLLDVTMETGRTHQIRAHMSHIGHPLAGDTMYGPPQQEMPRHALHCRQVRFVHPVEPKTISADAALPQDMLTFACEKGLLPR